MTAAKRPARRRGKWTYGDHPELTPGWRLDGTSLVLDYDPLSLGASLKGAYYLYIDGVYRTTVDHYLDGSMEWVESCLAERLCVGGSRTWRQSCGRCPSCDANALAGAAGT